MSTCKHWTMIDEPAYWCACGPREVFDRVQGLLEEDKRDEAFSVARGLYWHCVDYHGGQGSERYLIQCELGYNPSPFESDCSDDPEAQDVYDRLSGATR